jgi:hypothetical protein
MKRRRRTRRADGSYTGVRLRELHAFATKAADALISLGARRIRPAYEYEPRQVVVCAGEFELDTEAGSLRVTVYGDDIMTRFADAEAGNRLVGATVSSGKWNFHPFMVGLDVGEADPEARLLDLFLERVRLILRTRSERTG